MAMAYLKRIFAGGAPRAELAPLYAAVVRRARDRDWYAQGMVPDTLDGRFDMVSLVMALVLERLDALGDADAAARLTELFVSDMDGQLREAGIGDVIVGKHIGRMMSALGGRLGAYRTEDDQALRAALVRNVWRGTPPEGAALDHVASQVTALAAQIATLDLESLKSGAFAA